MEKKKKEVVLPERFPADEKEGYRLIFNNAPIGILQYDANGVITECNPKSIEMAGSAREKVIGINIFKDIKNDKLIKAVKDSLAGKSGHTEGEYTSVTGGRKFFAKADYVPVLSADAKVRGGICVVEDITKKVEAGKALQQSEEKYRTILESIEDGYFEVDLAGSLTFFNKALCDILGYTEAELSGKNYQSYMDAENAQKTFQVFNQVFKTGVSSKGYEWKIIRSSGVGVYLDTTVSPVRDTHEKVIGFRGFTRDVSERRLMEKFLAESEERYRLLFDSAPVGIFHYDKKGIIRACNQVFADIGGFSLSMLIGFNLLKNASKQLVRDAIKKTLAGLPGHYEGYYTLVTGGRTSYIKADFVPVFSEDDQVGGMCVVEDITERKKAEAALRESEARYRLIFDAAPVGIFHYMPDGTLTECNKKFAEMIGAPCKQLIGFNFLEHMSNERMIKVIRNSLNGEPGHYNGNYTSVSGGKTTHVKAAFVPVQSIDGHIEGGIGVIEDLTDKKKVEMELKKSEQEAGVLLNATTDAAVLLDSDGTIININDTFAKRFDKNREQIIGKNIWHKFPPNITIPRKNYVKEVFETGKPFEIVEEFQGIWDFVKIFPVSDVAGKVTRVAVFAQDITDRKRAEAALRESEEKYRGLAENSPGIILLLNRDGICQFVSPSVQRIVGYKPEEVIGSDPANFLFPDDREKAGKAISQVIKGKNVNNFETRVYKKDHSVAVLEWEGLPVIENGRITGVQFLGRDISERKAAEEELKKSRRQLSALSKHLQQSREQERAGIAREIHDDLGQSLTAIKMEASWLKSKIPEDQEVLTKKAEDTISLVDSAIQSVKRISAELRPGLLDDLGLSAAIEWQASDYQKRSGINIHVTMDPEEISLNPDLSIAIFRVCQESLTNVIRHSRATEAWVDLSKNRKHVVLVVKDNGIGIKETAASKKESFGLIGMRERVHSFGGRINIFSMAGGGTKVSVRVPLSNGMRQ